MPTKGNPRRIASKTPYDIYKEAALMKNTRERKSGRFRKRFSGERPVSLGFELTFLSEFKRVVWRVLDRTAKRCACISQAHATVPSYLINYFKSQFYYQPRCATEIQNFIKPLSGLFRSAKKSSDP